MWVGHNSQTVEKKIIEEELGLKRPIPIESVEDTMIRPFLCNAELSKGTDEDDEDYKERGLGLSYVSLWSMSSPLSIHISIHKKLLTALPTGVIIAGL
jgi:hypothetical protein